MNCPHCQSPSKKAGKHLNGLQRFQCKSCKRRFAEERPRPLNNMRLPLERALLCLQLLVEGSSIRSTERITGVEKSTIISLLLLAGEKCERLLNKHIRNIKVADVQADEIWGFVYCKQKTKHRLGKGDEFGDVYCFVAIERNTKLVLAWHVGKRSMEDTEAFTEKLRRATTGPFQISTDGWESYPQAIGLCLGTRTSYAQLIKTYAPAHPSQSPEGERRYSPTRAVEIIHRTVHGNPDPALICTSHVERQNLTIRMMMRRLTRLTNAFSKKRENLRAALALHFAYYNFCRIHQTLRCTPAMEAGVTKNIWELRNLLE